MTAPATPGAGRLGGADARARSAQTLLRATGRLSTAAMERMESDMPWFRDLSAEDRSWVGLIVQAGIRNFIDWYRDDADDPDAAPQVATSVFGAAPRALAGVITLQQTVDLVRLSIEVVESNIDQVLAPEDSADVHAGVLRYAREVAFATAEVYARAAEVRGAWDARLEALVVDAVLRAETDEALLSRASAVGGATVGASAWCWVRRPSGAPRTTCSTTYAVPRGPPTWTRCARCRATGWWCCSGAWPRRPRRPSRWCGCSERVRSSWDR